MIQYLRHTEIDKRKWDECLENSNNHLLYAYSWYLDIVCAGWDALVEDDYTSIMPLPKGDKYGFIYSYPPPFCQQLGLFSKKEITKGKITDFLSSIPSHFKYIEMNLSESNSFILTPSPSLSNREGGSTKEQGTTLIASLPGERGQGVSNFKTRNLVTHLLDLKRDYNTIYSSCSAQTKRNLKKALSSSLTISHSVPPVDVITLFSSNRGKQYQHPASYYLLLENLIKTIIDKGLGQSQGVFDSNNELCAGAFFLECFNRSIFLFSGTNKTAFETHAMTLLINNYLQEKAGQLSVFDFEGSMNTNLARFYSGFGSERVEFLQIRRNNLPIPFKWIKEL